VTTSRDERPSITPTPEDTLGVFAGLEEALIACDRSGRILIWNPAAERLFGHAAASVLGADCSLIEPPEAPRPWWDEVLSGRPRRLRATRVTSTGHRLSVEVTASPMRGADGAVIGVSQLFRPIENTTGARLLDLAEDMAHVGHWRVDLATREVTWSDEVYRIHDLDPATVTPTLDMAIDVYHPDDRDRVAGLVEAAMEQGDPFAFEARILRPSGEIRRVMSQGVVETGPTGNAVAITGVFQDVTEQMDREAAIAARDRANRILRQAIDAIDDAISIYDEEDRFVLANHKYFDLYPYLRETPDLPGKTFEDVLRISLAHQVVQSGNALDDPEGYVARRMEDRRRGRGMPDRQHSDGRWYLIKENKSVGGYTITTRMDITDRKVVEQKLANTSLVLQAILDTMPSPLVAFDRGNRLVAWNSGFADLVRIDPAKLLRGRPLVGLSKEILRLTPSTEAGIKRMFRAIRSQESVEFEWRRDDDQIFFVTGRPVADGGYLSMWRNVTAERRAQAMIRETQQRLIDAIETMSEAFALFDKNDVLVLCNSRYQTIYPESERYINIGATFEEIVYAAVRSGYFPEAVGREDEWAEERLSVHRNPLGHPIEQPLADGRVLLISDYRTKEGGTVSLRADITERIRTENELRSARDGLVEQARSLRALADEIDAARRRAEEAGEAKSRFLATMSHELRTPMTGLLGMIELLSRTDLDDDQRGSVRTMRSSAETLLALLNDILDFSKLEAGKVQLEAIPFSPSRVMRDVIQLFQGQSSKKGLILKSELDPSLPLVLTGDPLRLKQILSNLISNAIKFTADGSIVVRLASESCPGDMLRITGSVTDTGQGISPEVQDDLFRAFEQGDTSTTRRFGGTGLGLAICRRLVEGMGGEISVESRLGEGATFRFSVLMAPARNVTLPSEDDEAAASMGNALMTRMPPVRILLAEDNDVNRMLISKILAQSGHRVTEAVDGLEALEAVRRGTYDLVLMDMQMPVMDGLEATRAIRALPPPGNATPVVALTADALAEHRERYLGAGVDEVLTKPVDWRQLDRTMLRMLGLSEAPDGPRPPVQPERAAPIDSLPAFDRDRLHEAVGSLPPKRAASMVLLVPEEARLRADDLVAAIETGDLPAARRAAHTIKGLAANFGATRLQAAAMVAEAACGSVEALRAVLPVMLEAVADVEIETQRIVEMLNNRD